MMAQYVGIDVGKHKNYLCVLNERQEVSEICFFRHTLADYQKISGMFGNESRIVIEPTGAYAINLFLYLRKHGFDIRFCDTRSSTHTIRSETNGIKQKNDSIDAKGLALHGIIHWDKCRDHLHFINNIYGYDNVLFYIRVKELLNQSKLISREIARTKNRIDCVLSIRFPELAYVFSKPNSRLAMRFMCLEKEDYNFPPGEIARFIGADKRMLHYVEEMKSTLQNSVSNQTGLFTVKLTETRQLVREMQILEKEKKEIDDSLKELIATTDFKKLYDFKGINTVGIATLITEIRDIKRFFVHNEDGSVDLTRSLKCFRKFCGFIITSNQSGGRDGAHKLASGCNRRLRELFFLMALTYASLPHPNEITAYYEDKCKLMIKKKAILKTANHLVAKIFYEIKDLRWDLDRKI